MSGMATHVIDRIAVDTDGDGDPVLMIHGLGGTSNVWLPVLPVFTRQRTIRPDLPGSGRSARVEGPLSIERFVQAMLRVTEVLKIERAHVVAHSMGTIVAFHLAAAAPRLVRSLALFGPVLALGDAVRAPMRARAAKARNGGDAGMQEIADALVQGATSADTRARNPLALAYVRESVMRQTPDGYGRSCDALADAQAADVSTVTCPTLLVTGDEDQVAPPQAVRMIGERIPGARVEVFARCGHWTTIEKPDASADVLRRFYAQRM